MANELNIKALYKVFSEENTLETFRVFGNLWDKRDELIGKMFKEYFIKELKFQIHSDDEECSVFKKIIGDINIGFHSDYSFGFVHTPKKGQIKTMLRTNLKMYLENEKLQGYFTNDKVEGDGYWLYKVIDHNKIKKLLDLKILVEELDNIVKQKKHGPIA